MRLRIGIDRPLDAPILSEMSAAEAKAWIDSRRRFVADWGGFRLFAGEAVILGASNIKHYDYRHEIGFPLWAPLAAGCVLPALTCYRTARRLRRDRHGLCRECGYDVRASGDRCPECGSPVARSAS
jgi:hypothetical protein